MGSARTKKSSYAGLARILAAFSSLVVGLGSTVYAAEPVDSLYDWQPVRLGAGGFVTGFVTHPLDSSIRYCRTDVGNAYRWDGGEWRPMVVRAAGKGMPAAVAATPASCGVDSIAVDPSHKNVVFLTMKAGRPAMLESRPSPTGGNVFKSTDGGITFTAGNLSLAMEPNGPWRTEGERLKVDANNGEVIFYGSLKDGLWRSRDGGRDWTRVQGDGAPGTTANVLGVHPVAAGGTADARRAEMLPHRSSPS